MKNEKPNTDDLRDRLIDGGLREVVGQDAPPDLSERILAAADGKTSRPLSTLAPGENDMATQHEQANRKRNLWVGVAIAASLSLVGFFVIPATKDKPQLVNKSLLEKKEPKPKIVSDQKLDRHGAQTLNVNGGTSVELPEFNVIPVEKTISVPDGGTVFTGGMKRLAESREETELRMASESQPQQATPPVAIQAAEAGRPGLSAQGSAPSFVPADAMALQGLISDDLADSKKTPAAQQNLPDYSVDLDGPFRNNSFGLAVPSFNRAQQSEGEDQSGPNTDAGLVVERPRRGASVGGGLGGGELRGGEYGSGEYGRPSATDDAMPAAEQAKHNFDQQQFFSREKRSSSGQRFRIDASPGQEVNRYAMDFGKPIKHERNFDWSQRAAESKMLAPSQQSTTEQLHRDVSRKLSDKLERYTTLAEELGGAESESSKNIASMQLNEVRGIQGQIMKAKEELTELGVREALSQQSANSRSATEQAVAEVLSEDPILHSYRQEEYAIAQQLRTLKSTSKKGISSEVKRLESSLQKLRQEAEKHRQENEQKVRTALQRSPNDVLAIAATEYRLRKANARRKITKLEKELHEKVAEIRSTGNVPSSKLATLESEIGQLKELELSLEQRLRRQGLDPDQGQGPDASGDKYTRIYENPFIPVKGEQAVSTFSIDVDTASYANVRQFLMQSGQLPPPDAVRIEELVNYFDYDYTAPTGDTPFASHVEVAGCPWQTDHRLVRVGIKGREIATENRPQSNLVFLIDVSGSMNEQVKLPLLVEGMKMLTRELGENDRVAIVVYASSEGLALPSTRGDQQDTILAALDQLRAGGSTAGGAGIELAYKIATDNFIKGGVNRVVLATDGDFNVGTTSTAELERMAETNAKETGVFLTVLGFGRGNLNDEMMERISGKGNGNYHYVDNKTEAEKVLVAEMAGTLVTIAKDVKIQIEFNPAQVAGYRLIGYENRMLKTQDFNDDKKDAGEIGAGHTVTAIYEVVPAGKQVETPAVDPLKYQQPAKTAPSTAVATADAADASGELLTLKIRYKQPDGDTSTKLEFPITDNGQSFAAATNDFKFASAVASFGMLLRNSEHRGYTSYSAVEEIAQDSTGEDTQGYRAEFLQLVRHAKQLAGE